MKTRSRESEEKNRIDVRNRYRDAHGIPRNRVVVVTERGIERPPIRDAKLDKYYWQ